MTDWKRQGRELWRGWLGIPDAPVSERTSGELEPLVREVLSPVHENQGWDEKFTACRVDRRLGELARQQGITPRPFWPDSAPYALCLTHDIDRIFSTLHGLRRRELAPLRRVRTVFRDTATALVPGWKGRNPYFNFSRMEALEREWGIRSACYVLFEKRRYLKTLRSGEIQHVVGVYDPRAIAAELRRYAELGNEVGLHGSFDSWNEPASLNRELKSLREMGAGEVYGVRNHYLNFDFQRSIPIQKEAGLLYDSTMGFNFQNGFRCGTSFPFLLQGHVEVPFVLMDSALRHQFPDPASRLPAARRLLGEVRDQGGVAVLNWHLQVMNAEAFPKEIDILSDLIGQARRDGAWICRPVDVAMHWKGRLCQAAEIL